MNKEIIENKNIEQLSDELMKAMYNVVKYTRETFSDDADKRSVIQLTESWFDLATAQFNSVLRDIACAERKHIRAFCPSCGKTVNTVYTMADNGRLDISAYVKADGSLSDIDIKDASYFGPFKLVCDECGAEIAKDYYAIEELVNKLKGEENGTSR